MIAHYISLIIDDDEESTGRLRSVLSVSYPEYPVVAVGCTVQEGIDLVMKYRPSVLFLDVELPDGTGFDLLNSVREELNWQMRVVFYTAYNKYLLQAFRADGFDFLLKPFTETEMAVVIERLQTALPPRYSLNKEYFYVNTPSGSKVFHLSRIGYFVYDSEIRQWHVCLSELGAAVQTYCLRKRTDANQILSASNHFVQVHRSFIINADYLCGIDSDQIQLTPPFNECCIKLSRKYKKNVSDTMLWL
ncbi:MAG: response regulator transcription factor [Prevotellaceae bacterium]|jgi:two-component system LytT family response regulator|nr:response regulator transcription factor [Prevotellaceae bacterium]